jgi:hypothetical protein
MLVVGTYSVVDCWLLVVGCMDGWMDGAKEVSLLMGCLRSRKEPGFFQR